MKILDTKLRETSESTHRFDISDPQVIKSFTGNFYSGLAWFDLISSIVSVLACYWTDQLHITFSFIFFFWIGRSLKEGIPAARKWAIANGFVFTALSIAGFFLDGFRASIGSLTFHKGDVGFAIVLGIFTILFMIPAIVLLGERGRRAFPANKKQNKPDMATPRKPSD